MVIFHGYVKYTKSTMGIQWNVGGYFWFSAPSMLSNLVLFVGCCVRYIRCIYLFRKCVNFLETTWESRIEESDCILRRKHRKPYHDWWLSICIDVRECKQTNTCHTNDFMCMYIYIYKYTHTHICTHVLLCLCRFRQAHWTPHFFQIRGYLDDELNSGSTRSFGRRWVVVSL